ncbi:hypothetical protein [Neorickettsia findlayensis]|uniref:hypothetical protein n=1 Tax=Neorickettsia findlayensis TaxID=2686014 RepID=UPI001F42691D|nr:hypothetical protein [Neorickettsia findlayensis]
MLLSAAFLLFSFLLSFVLCTYKIPLGRGKDVVHADPPRSFFRQIDAKLLHVEDFQMHGCYLSSENLLGCDNDEEVYPQWGGSVIVVDPNERIVLHGKYDGSGVFGKMYHSLRIFGHNPFYYVSRECLLKYGVCTSLQFSTYTSCVFLLHSSPPYIPLTRNEKEYSFACKVLKKRFLLILRLAKDQSHSYIGKITNIYIPFLHNVESFTASEKELYMDLFANAFSEAVTELLRQTTESLSEFIKIPDIRICCGSLAMRDMLELAFEREFERSRSVAEASLKGCIARMI